MRDARWCLANIGMAVRDNPLPFDDQSLAKLDLFGTRSGMVADTVLELLELVDRLRHDVPDVRLVFMGGRHPNPAIPEMRVAVAHPFFWPEVRRGAERFAHELARGLGERGHDVRLVTSHRASQHAVQDAYSLRCTPQVHGACRDLAASSPHQG